MKKSLIIFLQLVIVAFGVGALTVMLWEPQIEGRNANATQIEVYFKDPFLVYVYIASTFFFIALYQTFKLIEYIGQNKMFSPSSIKALRTIKYCAVFFVGLILAPIVYLFVARPDDDIAGGVAMGLFLVFVSALCGTVAAVLERHVHRGVKLKSENDLTI